MSLHGLVLDNLCISVSNVHRSGGRAILEVHAALALRRDDGTVHCCGSALVNGLHATATAAVQARQVSVVSAQVSGDHTRMQGVPEETLVQEIMGVDG